MLRSIATASRLPIETIVGPGRGRAAAQARAVAACLLRNDAGITLEDTARILHRKTGTVSELTSSMDRLIGSADPRAPLLERARRLLKNGSSMGKPYPPLAPGPGAARLLPGLLACRMGAGLMQPELADRAGMARDTIARLERLRRRARAETVEMLARALGVPAHRLTALTEGLPAVLRSAHGSIPS